MTTSTRLLPDERAVVSLEEFMKVRLSRWLTVYLCLRYLLHSTASDLNPGQAAIAPMFQ